MTVTSLSNQRPRLVGAGDEPAQCVSLPSAVRESTSQVVTCTPAVGRGCLTPFDFDSFIGESPGVRPFPTRYLPAACSTSALARGDSGPGWRDHEPTLLWSLPSRVSPAHYAPVALYLPVAAGRWWGTYRRLLAGAWALCLITPPTVRTPEHGVSLLRDEGGGCQVPSLRIPPNHHRSSSPTELRWSDAEPVCPCLLLRPAVWLSQTGRSLRSTLRCQALLVLADG